MNPMNMVWTEKWRPKKVDDIVGVRVTAARALGNIRPVDIEVIPALILALKSDYMFSVRETAAEALGEIGPAAVDAVTVLNQSLFAGRADNDPFALEL